MVNRFFFGTKDEMVVVQLYCKCMLMNPLSEYGDMQKDWFRKEWIHLDRKELRRLQRQHRKCKEKTQ